MDKDNLKKILVEYKSDGFLPAEIDTSINTVQERILRDHLEYDKIICHIGTLRGDIIRFLAGHGIMDSPIAKECQRVITDAVDREKESIENSIVFRSQKNKKKRQ